ncbi:VOC family protein [Mucilaginibacter ximonensis]|uniref:VOC family protein n=1 Tax=Mucilaginibacter ximonensis TaxID=538021 RepID=A0ABW5Y6S8_9SPHI
MENIKLGAAVPQLPVVEVEKAQTYYCDILGFELLWTYPDKYIGAVGRGDLVIFFAKTTQPITPCYHWIFTETVDEAYQELKARGADIVENIEDKPWNIRQFAIKDLNGHIFYIHQG